MTTVHADAVTSLLDVLDVQAIADEEDAYAGHNLQENWPDRIFGGQVLGQLSVAAGRTVPAGRALHSLHAYFLRPGDTGREIRLKVERLRDGRSFSARRVQAVQGDTTILSGIVSFQSPGSGPEHAPTPPVVPGPQDLVPDDDLVAGLDHPLAAHVLARNVEVRRVDVPLYTSADPVPRAQQALWFRSREPLGEDPLVHQAVLAYASDYSLLEPALRRHGLAWTEPDLVAASLDHAMWWHRPARADEWILHVTEAPNAQGARALTGGRMYDTRGRLVATTAQEGLLRLT